MMWLLGRRTPGPVSTEAPIHISARVCARADLLHMLWVHAYSYVGITDMKIGRRITRRRCSPTIAASRAQVDP